MKCKLTVLITSFVCALAIIINPLTASANEAGGDYSLWDGDLLFYDNTITIPLYQSFSNLDHFNSDGDMTKEYKVASFVGTASNLLKVTGTTGTFLNGNASTSYTFTVNNTETGTVSVSLADNTYDGMQISSLLANIQGNKTVVTIYVNFNNFEITNPVMYFPVTFNVSYSAKYDEIFDIIPDVITVNASGNDWLDSVRMFSSIEDLPGSKGFLARAFDSIKTHLTSLFNGLKTNDNANTKAITDAIGNSSYDITESMSNYSYGERQNADKNSQNEMNNATANSQAEINQSKENTEKMVNGYDAKNADTTENIMENELAGISQYEEQFFDIGEQYIDSFTFNSGFSDDVNGSFSLISSFMQAMFEASGKFGSIALCSFGFILFRMISGQTKFL